MIKESAGSDSTEFITVINWFEEIGCLRCLLLVMCTYPVIKKRLRSI